MADSGRNTAQSGGSLLAIAIILGAIGGYILGQPSIGILIGITVGIAALILVWLKDRKR